MGACVIAPLELADEEELHALLRLEPDPPRDVPRPSSEAAVQAFVAGARDEWLRGSAWLFGVREGGALVGATRLGGARSRAAQLSYWIAGPYRGRGLGTAAARATVGHAFGALLLAEVQAFVRDDNAPSRRLLARLGFRDRGSVPSLGVRWYQIHSDEERAP
jgi:[ribosomal protein S5]-alanine N-acetyltransferase